MRVALFVPCFINTLAPRVAAASKALLEAQGLTVEVPLDQTCCGQPAFNAGCWDEATPVAAHTLDVFRDYDRVIAPSGSCITMIKVFYARLFPPDHPRHPDVLDLAGRVSELCSFLVDDLGVDDVGATFHGTVTYHDACHALRELDIREAPRRLLRAVKGLSLVEMEHAETCCGFGGTFATKHADISCAMGREKLGWAEDSQASLIVTTDSSCLLHLDGLARKERRPLRFAHIAELLAGHLEAPDSHPSPMTDPTPASTFQDDARRRTHDPELHRILGKTLATYHAKVAESAPRWTDWQAARHQARAWKHDALNQLDTLLVQLEAALTAHGVEVHWAADTAGAQAILDDLVRRHDVTSVIKSKSMTTEEIGLNEFLEAKGLDVVESDLGEFIVQLRGEKPFHIVTPAMHLTQPMISDLFVDKLGIPHTDDAETLTAAARDYMRTRFLRADLGITGANFAIADPGLISITENEGNGVLSASSPRVHVALMGIEKVLPSLDQLALFLPLLAHSGTGQALTCYNSWFAGPRRDGEADGPAAMHLILLDNGRTDILADPEQRETLHCIRCGACLNACPIFRHVGGYTYGTVYQGPIGSVISPHLLNLKDYGHLSFASSLCGRCTEVCPVHIDLHHHLLENRRNQVARHNPSPGLRRAMRRFSRTMQSPQRYRRTARLARFGLRWLHRLPVLQRLPGLRDWTRYRSLPEAPAQSFLASQGACPEDPDRTAIAPHTTERPGTAVSRDAQAAPRDQILTAIRSALAVPVLHPPTPAEPHREWFPPLAPEDYLATFAANLEALQGTCHVEANAEAALSRIQSILREEDPAHCWAQPDLPEPFRELAQPAAFSGQADAKQKLADARVGITSALALVARHGSVLVAAPTQGGRLLSFLPDHHIVIARTDQLVGDLADAISLVRERFGGDWPTFVSIITGSSRTADIEKILVLGAHGPKRLTVVLYGY